MTIECHISRHLLLVMCSFPLLTAFRSSCVVILWQDTAVIFWDDYLLFSLSHVSKSSRVFCGNGTRKDAFALFWMFVCFLLRAWMTDAVVCFTPHLIDVISYFLKAFTFFDILRKFFSAFLPSFSFPHPTHLRDIKTYICISYHCSTCFSFTHDPFLFGVLSVVAKRLIITQQILVEPI